MSTMKNNKKQQNFHQAKFILEILDIKFRGLLITEDDIFNKIVYSLQNDGLVK